MNTNESTLQNPGLCKVRQAAGRTGMSRNRFIVACERGDIPVELIKVGPRGILYARTAQIENFLNPHSRNQVTEPFPNPNEAKA